MVVFTAILLAFLGSARALSCYVINYLWGPSAMARQQQRRKAATSAPQQMQPAEQV